MALDKSKCDPELGAAVQAMLLEKEMASPTIEDRLNRPDKEKVDKISLLMAEVMDVIGLDRNDESLNETPQRIAKMFVNEFFWGLKPEYFPKCTTVPNKKIGYGGMLVENNIKVMSSCEHHFITIDGHATVAYIPKDKLIGLSKLNRIVEYFCKRPQVQERLAEQIHAAISLIVGTDDVAVLISAAHYCVKARGIEDQGSYTTTSVLGGAFRDESRNARNEFMQLALRSIGSF
jgi:GTP cyclohydrolase I